MNVRNCDYLLIIYSPFDSATQLCLFDKNAKNLISKLVKMHLKKRMNIVWIIIMNQRYAHMKYFQRFLYLTKPVRQRKRHWQWIQFGLHCIITLFLYGNIILGIYGSKCYASFSLAHIRGNATVQEYVCRHTQLGYPWDVRDVRTTDKNYVALTCA